MPTYTEAAITVLFIVSILQGWAIIRLKKRVRKAERWIDQF